MIDLSDYNPTITVHDLRVNEKVPVFTIEGARFFGRPNFEGRTDQFNESKRQFTLLLPGDSADVILGLGYNVKTTQPKRADGSLDLDAEPFRHLNVKLTFSPGEITPEDPSGLLNENGPDCFLIVGDKEPARLNSRTVKMFDIGRLDNVDLEIRAWEYNPKDAPNRFSARLNKAVITKPQAGIISSKYGNLGI